MKHVSTALNADIIEVHARELRMKSSKAYPFQIEKTLLGIEMMRVNWEGSENGDRM